MGALSRIASLGSSTGSKISKSTSIKLVAWLATSGEVAATAARAWPLYSTLSSAMQLLDRKRWFIKDPSRSAALPDSLGKSEEVTIAFTPGTAIACLMLMDLMIA